MALRELILINFRNIAYSRLSLSAGANVFYGKNAQGKTNFLESIYLSARATSFRTHMEREMIRFGERSAYVYALTERNGREKRIETKLSMVEKKRIRINGLEIERMRDLNEPIDVVLFAPEHLELVQGGPSVRRHFFNDLLKATEPTYARLLGAFEKILFQRNQLLKRQPKWFEEQLDVFDQQLSKAAVPLVFYRRKMLEHLDAGMVPTLATLTGRKEKLSLFYETEVDEEEAANLQRLREGREEDIRLRTSRWGPQHDDMKILLEGIPARSFASQGQSRTITLAFKLAEMGIRERVRGNPPILLLDDAFSELDDQRAKMLLQVIAPYQTIITTNQTELIRKMSPASCFYSVREGQIHPASA